MDPPSLATHLDDDLLDRSLSFLRIEAAGVLTAACRRDASAVSRVLQKLQRVTIHSDEEGSNCNEALKWVSKRLQTPNQPWAPSVLRELSVEGECRVSDFALKMLTETHRRLASLCLTAARSLTSIVSRRSRH